MKYKLTSGYICICMYMLTKLMLSVLFNYCIFNKLSHFTAILRCFYSFHLTQILTVGLICSVVPENIHAHPKEGQGKFQRGDGFQNPNFFNESMTQKGMEFLEGWGF